jgi:hypothetical protein
MTIPVARDSANADAWLQICQARSLATARRFMTCAVASRRLRAALPIAGEATRTDVRAAHSVRSGESRVRSRVLREADVVLGLVQKWPSTGSWSAAGLMRLKRDANSCGR